MRRILAVLMLLASWSVSLAAETITGRVIRCVDGDTLTVLSRGKIVKVRLAGVDCPERKQVGGLEAKQFTTDLTLGKRVSVAVAARPDRYGRSLGTVTLPDGRNLNQELLRAGHAWWYKAYSKDKSLQALEDSARAARAGLGALETPVPVPPWDFRRKR